MSEIGKELSDLLRAYSGVISTILLIKISSSQGTTNEVEIEYRNTATDTEYTSLGRAKTVGTSMRLELKDVEDGISIRTPGIPPV